MRGVLNEISIWVMWIVIALGVNFGLVAFAWVWNPPQLPIVEFNSPAATTVILTAVKQPVTLEVVMLPRPKDPIVVPVAYEGESKAERDKLFQATDKVIIDTTGRGVISLNFFPKAALSRFAEAAQDRGCPEGVPRPIAWELSRGGP